MQDNVFDTTGHPGKTTAGPTNTHLFVNTDEGLDIGPNLVTVGERTCFLHAAMRNELPSTLTTQLNGKALPLSY